MILGRVAIGLAGATLLSCTVSPGASEKSEQDPTTVAGPSEPPPASLVSPEAKVPATATRSSFDFWGNPPILGISPESIVHRLERVWRLTFRSFDPGTGTRWNGGRREPASKSAFQAIIVSDRTGNLRTLSCIAGNDDRRALNERELNFLYDCSLSIAGANQRTSLRSWLETHMPNDAGDGTTPGPVLPKLEATVSGVRIIVRWAPGLIDLTLGKATK